MTAKRPLNTAIVGDVRQLAGRWYPFYMEMDNALQTETWTALEFIELEFNPSLPEGIFTLRHLEGG